MALISVDPGKLRELSEYYSNSFDTKYKELKEGYEKSAGELSKTWEGEEAETANAALERVKQALERIEERSADYKRIVSEKVEGFDETFEKARTNFDEVNAMNNTSQIKF